MRIRRLERGEREEWLDLLDGWRGRDYFRRPIEDDPSYEDANVWVAEEADRLVCSVQIFPRELAASGVRVPTGGIGTVYTRPDRRGAGIASALLERSVEDMRARGMEISLLFAARMTSTTWSLSTPRPRPASWVRQPATPPPGGRAFARRETPARSFWWRARAERGCCSPTLARSV